MLDILLALSFWLAALYLFRPASIRRSGWNNLDEWLMRWFILAGALSLSFQVDAWAPSIDHLVGINNLTWLLGYVLTVVSGFCGLIGWGHARRYLSPRRIAFVCGGPIAIYMLLFPLLAQEAEHLHDDFAQTWPSLLFREISYLWMAVIAYEGIRMIHHYLRQEQLPTGHLRFGFLISALRCLFAFAVVRGLASFVVFFDPGWPFTHTALIGSDLILAGAVILFALFHAPMAWLRTIGRVGVYLDQQASIRELDRLRNQLVTMTSPLPWPPPTWRERWFQPSYSLYCILIDILDRRSLLLSGDQMVARTKRVPVSVQNLLFELPETPDWVEMLLYVRAIRKQHSHNEA
jgi:hypothetical protein